LFIPAEEPTKLAEKTVRKKRKKEVGDFNAARVISVASGNLT